MSDFSKFGNIFNYFARPIAIGGNGVSNSQIRVEWITLINSLATQAYFLIDVAGTLFYSIGLTALESRFISFPESTPLVLGGSGALVSVQASSTPFVFTPFIATQIGVQLNYRLTGL